MPRIPHEGGQSIALAAEASDKARRALDTVERVERLVAAAKGQQVLIVELQRRVEVLERRLDANGHDLSEDGVAPEPLERHDTLARPGHESEVKLAQGLSLDDPNLQSPSTPYHLEKDGDGARIMHRGGKDPLGPFSRQEAVEKVTALNDAFQQEACEQLYPNLRKTSNYPYYIQHKPGKNPPQPWMVKYRKTGDRVFEVDDLHKAVLKTQRLIRESIEGPRPKVQKARPRKLNFQLPGGRDIE